MASDSQVYAPTVWPVQAMQKLIDELTAALAKNKKLKTSTPAAVKVFVDYLDPRFVGAAAYGAAQEGQLAAMKLLHSLGV